MSRQPPAAEEILERLEWTVFRRLDGLLQGEYRTLFRGSGLDLADLREYELHDDVRMIDWNVTARLQTPYVREYLEEREVSAWFLCDLTPSIEFGSVRVAKREMLVDFVAVLARILTRGGNRIGALIYDGENLRHLPPRSGRRRILELVHEIVSHPTSTTASGTKSRSGVSGATGTDLRVLLDAARALIRRRSVIFLLSDFHSEPGWEASLGAIGMRNETLAIRLFNPLELALPDLGIVVLADSETGEQINVDTGDRKLRRRYEKIAAERAERLRGCLAEASVDALELSTEDDIVESILRFIQLRNYRKHLSGDIPRERIR